MGLRTLGPRWALWPSALVAIAIVVTALCGAPPASARYSPKKAIWGPVMINGRSQFPIYRDLGVGIFEMDLSWPQAAPTRPQRADDPGDPAYHWPAAISYAIQQGAKYHIRGSCCR